MSLQRTELQNRLRIALSFGQDSSCLLWHLESVIDSWQVYPPQSCKLVRAHGIPIHESVAVVFDPDLVVLIEECLVGGATHIMVDLLFCKDVAIICLNHCMFDLKLVVHVVEIAHKLLP